MRMSNKKKLNEFLIVYIIYNKSRCLWIVLNNLSMLISSCWWYGSDFGYIIFIFTLLLNMEKNVNEFYFFYLFILVS